MLKFFSFIFLIYKMLQKNICVRYKLAQQLDNKKNITWLYRLTQKKNC